MGGYWGKYVSKKGKTNITSIQIDNKTVKCSSEITSELNKHFPSMAEQTQEKLIKSKHKYFEYLKNSNADSFFISLANSDEVLSVNF